MCFGPLYGVRRGYTSKQITAYILSSVRWPPGGHIYMLSEQLSQNFPPGIAALKRQKLAYVSCSQNEISVLWSTVSWLAAMSAELGREKGFCSTPSLRQASAGRALLPRSWHEAGRSTRHMGPLCLSLPPSLCLWRMLSNFIEDSKRSSELIEG